MLRRLLLRRDLELTRRIRRGLVAPTEFGLGSTSLWRTNGGCRLVRWCRRGCRSVPLHAPACRAGDATPRHSSGSSRSLNPPVPGSIARYLALHPPTQFHGYTDESVGDLSNDQIEYADEDPSIRERFEEELGKRGLTSLMPDEAYKQRDYLWDYREAASA